MSLRRSERGKTPSLEKLSGTRQSIFLTTPVTSTRKRKVQPALKDRAEALLANAAVPGQRLKPPASSSKKRKLEDVQHEKPSKVPATTQLDLSSRQSSSKIKQMSKSKANEDGRAKKNEEKRLRRYRDKAPQSFLEKLHRAQTQR